MTRFEEEVFDFLQHFGTVEVADGPDHFFRVGGKTFVPKSILNHNEGQTGIPIWEDLWNNKRDILTGRISAVLGKAKRFHARETCVEKVDKLLAREFAEAHHLMGFAGGKVHLALKRGGNTLSVMSFGKKCPVEREGQTFESVEIIRYCTSSGTAVVGGLSKLLSHFSKQYPSDDLMTYVDAEWSEGDGFRKFGFEEIDRTEPQKFLVDPQSMKRYLKHEFHYAPESCVSIFNQGSIKLVKYFDK
ncbi:MAG: hypothetical protein HKN32_05890 [Flavobacteriales bacterium]|nr:hypothetical protein [Flavobacteriales bacterium]